MKRSYQVLIATVLVLVVVLVVPLVVLLVAPMTYAGLIERAVHATAGIEAKFTGLEVAVFPLGITVTGLELHNPDPAFEAPLLTARQLSVTAWIDRYVGDSPIWWQGAGQGVEVRLERSAQGESNWAIGAEDAPEQPMPDALFDFAALELADLTVIRLDESEHRFEISRLEVAHAADERLLVELAGHYQDQPLRAAGSLPLPTSDQARDVDFRAHLFGGTVRMTGRVGHDGLTPGRARFAVNVDDLSALAVLLDQDLGGFVPLRVSGTLAAPQPGHWQLSADGDVADEPVYVDAQAAVSDGRYELTRLTAEYGQRGVKGSGVLEDRQSAWAFSTRIEALRWPAEDQAWRLVAPLTAEGQVRRHQTSGEVSGFELALVTEGVDIRADGVMPAASGKPPRFDVRGEVSSLAAFRGPGLERGAYGELLPVDVDLQAGRDGAVWSVSLRGAGVAGTRLAGELEVDAAASPPSVQGTLRSPEIDLNDIPTTTAAATGDGEAEPGDDQEGPDELIPDSPLDWSWLTAAQVDVEVQVERLGFNQATFRNVESRVRLRDGELRVAPLKASLSQGGVRGHLEVARHEGGAQVAARLFVTELVPADLGQKDQGPIDGGTTNLAFDVRTRGISAADLAAGLDGEFVLEVQQATIRNDAFEALTADVLVEMISRLNPFVKRDEQTELRCAAVHVVAEEGILTSPNRALIETSKVVIRGGGRVDLRDESLRLDFSPSPRKGLGVSLGGLADLVRLGGTLSDPQIQTNPAGVLRGGAELGAAIATGGASLLAQGLFARARNVDTRCAELFEQQVTVPEAIRTPETDNAAPPD